MKYKPILIALAALLFAGGYVKGSHDKAQKWALSDAKRIQTETVVALKNANIAIKKEKKQLKLLLNILTAFK